MNQDIQMFFQYVVCRQIAHHPHPFCYSFFMGAWHQKVPSLAFIKKGMADRQCIYGKIIHAIPLPVFRHSPYFFSHRPNPFRHELIQVVFFFSRWRRCSVFFRLCWVLFFCRIKTNARYKSPENSGNKTQHNNNRPTLSSGRGRPQDLCQWRPVYGGK